MPRSSPSSGAFTPRERLEAVAARLPLAAGSFIGAAALVVPYVLITVVTFVSADRGDAISTAAAMFFTIVTFGPGERVVEGFVSVASITSLVNVRPADYPSVAAELEAAISVLQATPEAPLLVLYVAGPWVLYAGGRYLARHYTPSETPADVAITGATVAAGTFPVVVLLGIAFGPPNLLGTIVLFGIALPALLGAVGGLTVYVFRRETTATSTAVGWLGVLMGIVVSFVLSPWLPFSIDIVQRVFVATMAFLGAASMTLEWSLLSFVILVLVTATTIGAGFLRAWIAHDPTDSPADGARRGASVVRGYLGAVTFLGAVVPLSMIVIGLPAGTADTLAAAQPDLVGYLQVVLVGGVVFPLVFGSLGGYLATRTDEADRGRL